MKILVDFDGVLHNPHDKLEGQRMGQPIEGAFNAMSDLMVKGHDVIVFTVRASTEQSTQVVREWLWHYNIPFTNITNIKERADYYIDDRAIRFTSWSETLPQIV